MNERSRPGCPANVVLFVLVVPLLSGCVGSEATTFGPSAGAGPDADGAPFGFEPPLKVGDAPGTVVITRGEAFVATHGEEMLVCTHGTFTAPALTWASRDGGRTFEVLTFPPETVVAGDCDVRIGPDGTWYVLHSTVEAATLTASTDDGATWRVNPLTTFPISLMADRPWLQVTPDGALLLTAMDIYFGPGFVSFTRSDDQGETWTRPVLIATPEGPDAVQHMHGRPFVAGDGRIMVPLRSMRETGAASGSGFGSPAITSLSLLASADGGVSWERIQVTETGDGYSSFPMASVSGDGTLFVVEPLPVADGTVFATFVSTDDGATWDGPFTAAGPFADNAQVWLHGGPDASATAAWVVPVTNPETGALEPTLMAARLSAQGAVMSDVAILGVARPPEFLMVTHDDAGKARIVHTSERAMWLHTEQ